MWLLAQFSLTFNSWWALCKCLRGQNNSAEFLGRYFLEGLYLKSGSKISGKLLILLVTMMLTKPYFFILRLDGAVKPKPAIVTDTHCIRLCNRIGLVDGIKDPKKVEMALWKIIPPEEGSDFCHRLVYHGREVCTARTKPYCDKCCLEDICQKNIWY